MPLIELVEQVLRPFDRARHELRKKHYIGGIGDDVCLGLLPASIDLDNVAQALKCVKRQTDRQDDVYRRSRKLPAPQSDKADEAIGEEIEILEREKYKACRRHACPE